MKILFLTDNFPPEVNAPASRTYSHCKVWAEMGIEVTVITCFPNFPEGKVFDGYRNGLFKCEIIDGIRVLRIWSYISANRGTLKRILDYLSFMVSSFIIGLFIRTDLIIATSPQFFTAVSGRWLAFWKRKKWVMEIRDLWPESIEAVGAIRNKWIYKRLKELELNLYSSAWKIVVVTNSFKSYLSNINSDLTSKTKLIRNGVDSSLFFPRAKNNMLINHHNLKNKVLMGYIGTLGMAHGLDFILDCADELHKLNIHILIIGSGAERENLLRQKQKNGLSNITILDRIPKISVPDYLSILDIGLVNLKKSETFRKVIPSKIFELSAHHIPILLGVEGEAKELVEQYEVGISFKPEDSADFIDKTKVILGSTFRPSNFDRLTHDFDRKKLAKEMIGFIES